jgi:hypothetical protein
VKLNDSFVIGGLMTEELEQTSMISVEFNSRKPNMTD